MSLRYRNLLSILVLCLTFGAAPAFAAKPSNPVTEPVPAGTTPDETTGVPACAIGQTDPATYVIKFIFPPNDEYHTLIDPAGCCPAGGATLLTTAHIDLNWGVPCQIPVSVTILGSDGAQCPAPDPNNVICPPTTYILDGSAGGAIVHDLPLPPGCCIQGPAFIKIDFLSNGNCQLDPDGLNAPRLLADNTPDACVSYNYYPGDPTYRDVVAYYGFPGNPRVWADGECCGVTSSFPSTWGKVKTLYR